MTDEQIMRDALNALKSLTEGLDEDCGDPKCEECGSYRPAFRAIAQLQDRLGGKPG